MLSLVQETLKDCFRLSMALRYVECKLAIKFSKSYVRNKIFAFLFGDGRHC
jgi:hypothetical protein